LGFIRGKWGICPHPVATKHAATAGSLAVMVTEFERASAITDALPFLLDTGPEPWGTIFNSD
jgi:hypothetical protein